MKILPKNSWVFTNTEEKMTILNDLIEKNWFELTILDRPMPQTNTNLLT